MRYLYKLTKEFMEERVATLDESLNAIRSQPNYIPDTCHIIQGDGSEMYGCSFDYVNARLGRGAKLFGCDLRGSSEYPMELEIGDNCLVVLVNGVARGLRIGSNSVIWDVTCTTFNSYSNPAYITIGEGSRVVMSGLCPRTCWENGPNLVMVGARFVGVRAFLGADVLWFHYTRLLTLVGGFEGSYRIEQDTRLVVAELKAGNRSNILTGIHAKRCRLADDATLLGDSIGNTSSDRMLINNLSIGRNGVFVRLVRDEAERMNTACPENMTIGTNSMVLANRNFDYAYRHRSSTRLVQLRTEPNSSVFI